jgi:hypothetical protein
MRMIGFDGSLGWVNPFTGDLTTYILPPANSAYTAQLQMSLSRFDGVEKVGVY